MPSTPDPNKEHRYDLCAAVDRGRQPNQNAQGRFTGKLNGATLTQDFLMDRETLPHNQ